MKKFIALLMEEMRLRLNGKMMTFFMFNMVHKKIQKNLDNSFSLRTC